MILCESCQSPRLLYVRHDGDWGGGDQTRLNPDEVYDDGDLDTGSKEVDIAVTLCLNCGSTS